MTIRTLELHHEIDLPPAIVWDALVDPLLVGGWLGDARIDPVIGGRYDLDWLGSTDFPATDGRIVELDEPEALVVATSVHGLIGFDLERCHGAPAARGPGCTSVSTSMSTMCSPSGSRATGRSPSNSSTNS